MKNKIFAIAIFLSVSIFYFLERRQYKQEEKERIIREIKDLTDRADRITEDLEKQMKVYLEE